MINQKITEKIIDFMKQVLENNESKFGGSNAKKERYDFYKKTAKEGMPADLLIKKFGNFEEQRLGKYLNEFFKKLEIEIEKNPKRYRNFDFKLLIIEFERPFNRLFLDSKKYLIKKGQEYGVRESVVNRTIGTVGLFYDDCIAELRNKLAEFKKNLAINDEENSEELQPTEKMEKSNEISQNREERLEEKNKAIEKNNNKSKKKVPWFKDSRILTLIVSIIILLVMCISFYRPQRVIISNFEKSLNHSKSENSLIHKDEMEISHEDENVSELQLTDLNDLAIKAGFGDRYAFEELRMIANSNESEESNFAKKVVTEIIKKYSGKMYLEVTINTEVPNYIVVEALNDINPDTRKMAIYTVNKRKLYSEIPTLILKIKSEEDLDVLAAIYRTLNNLLPTKVSMFQEDADSIFQIALNKKRNTNP